MALSQVAGARRRKPANQTGATAARTPGPGEAIAGGASVIFEGAQGTMLDVDHGTYPYITASSTTAGGASIGTGVPPTKIDGVLGVMKAYTTRGGGGAL